MRTCPTWKGLREVVDTRAYLAEWPPELRTVVALALSVAHWSPEAREGYDDVGNKEGKAFLHHGCALCDLHPGFSCKGCPLQDAGAGCQDNTSGDSLWFAIHKIIEHGPSHFIRPYRSFHAAADKMYNKLVELYRIEWEKL